MRIEKGYGVGSGVVVFLVVGLLITSNVDSRPGPGSGPGSAALGENSRMNSPSGNDYARLFAGLSTSSSPLDVYESKPAWIAYANLLDQNWKKLQEKQLTPMKEWASREFSAPASSNLTVFYPFSGPDFINPYTLFPHAKTYLLIALEPPGEIPAFDAGSNQDLDSFFARLQNSIHDLLHVDYFISAHMRADFKGKELKGVLPIILLIMARENLRVLEVEHWLMKPDGTVEEAPAVERGRIRTAGIPGLRIVFEAAGSPVGRPQTLYYFRFNLNNFHRSGRFASFLKSFSPLITFMKSASFVMFDPRATASRQFVLDHSRYVLQEDSGIPFRYFDPAVWNLQLYGVYKEPIAVFRRNHQKDLAEVYKAGKDIKSLPFGIGYHFKIGEANLMLATRK